MKPQNIPSNPEALEALLASKSFDALTPEEQAYALEHLSSREEYSSMRALMLALSEETPTERIAPRPETKDDLMALFEQETPRTFRVWLNGIGMALLPKEREWYRQPAYALAMASVAVIIGWFALRPAEPVAYAEATTEREMHAETPEPADNERMQAGSENEIAAPGEVVNEEAGLSTSQDETNTEYFRTVEESPQEIQREANETAMPETTTMVTEDLIVEMEMVADEDVEVDDFALNTSTESAEEEIPAVRKDIALRDDHSVDNGLMNGSAWDGSLGYTAPASELDTQWTATNTNPVDQYLYNSMDTPVTLGATESLESVTIAAESDLEEVTSTRGLDVTFVPATTVGETAEKYSGLLDLMVTEW